MKFRTNGKVVEALQCTEDNLAEVAALVRVPGATDDGCGGFRFGLNGSWRRIYPSEWVIRFGDDVYDHDFLDDKTFKALFVEER
jgi:hypothetical protein